MSTAEDRLNLLGTITQAAVEWAEAYELEHSRDERALESTVIARTIAARKLQEIRRLVKELTDAPQTQPSTNTPVAATADNTRTGSAVGAEHTVTDNS